MVFKGFEKVRHGTYKGLLSELRNLLPFDGTATTVNTPLTMTGNIAMGSNKLTGLAAGSTAGDSVRYEQLTALNPFVATVTLGASGGTITHTFVTGYDYRLIISGAVPNTDGGTVFLRLNGDATLTAYDWYSNFRNTAVADASDDAFDLTTNQGLGSATGEYLHCVLDLDLFHSTSEYKSVIGLVRFKTAAGTHNMGDFGGLWNNTSAVTSFKLDCTGGTTGFASGTMSLYRFSRS